MHPSTSTQVRPEGVRERAGGVNKKDRSVGAPRMLNVTPAKNIITVVLIG